MPSTESCDRIADVLGVDLDLVLTMAGHRPADAAIDADSPAARIAGLVRRIDWTPDRMGVVKMLEQWIDDDRRAREERTGER